jgi:hypothetical protein
MSVRLEVIQKRRPDFVNAAHIEPIDPVAAQTAHGLAADVNIPVQCF